jgi:hypothetical protein
MKPNNARRAYRADMRMLYERRLAEQSACGTDPLFANGLSREQRESLRKTWKRRVLTYREELLGESNA